MSDIEWFVVGWVAADICKSVLVFIRRERGRDVFSRQSASPYAVVRWWRSYLA